MVTADIQALHPGQGCRAAQLTVKGKLLADLIVYDCGESGFLLELVATARESVLATLNRHLIMDDATVADESSNLGELGVYGEKAAAALAAVLPATPESALRELPPYHFVSDGKIGDAATTLIASNSELFFPGFHLIGPKENLEAIAGKLAAHAPAMSDADFELRRIEAGTPIYGIDIDEDRMPAEAGLEDAVSTTKGCYLGQEVVVRLRDRGHLNRKLCGLRLLDDGEPPARGTLLRHESKPNAGIITSSVSSPRCGTIALGYVHRSVFAPGTTLELISSDEKPLLRSAQVVPLPFPPKAP